MKLFKKMYIRILGGLAVAGIVYFGFLQWKMTNACNGAAPPNADYLIVLGAKVNGTVPSLVLKERIRSAAKYMKKNNKTMAIVSGGKGPGEDISEAETMRRELVKLGITDSRIILEDRSTDTYENIRNSKALIPNDAQLGIVVTNNFHIYRALEIAKDNGLKVSGLPAKTPTIAIFKGFSREYLAITKYYILIAFGKR